MIWIHERRRGGRRIAHANSLPQRRLDLERLLERLRSVCNRRPSGPQIVCKLGEVCKNGQGCVTSVAGTRVCSGSAVHTCAKDGAIGALVKQCDGLAGEACVSGERASACALAGARPSNVGCELWAVDLDDEPEIEAGGVGKRHAAAEPWALVLSNVGRPPPK